MSISVVLLQYDFSELTRISLETVRENEPDEIILVDNGSKAGQFEWIGSEPGVRLVRLNENVGWLRGINAGWKEAQNEFIVLCNNDIALSRQCLRRLKAGMEQDPGIGWLSACYQDGAWQNSRTAFPEDIKRELNQSRGVERGSFNAWALDLGETPVLEYASLTEATVVMVRRSISQQVGYFWDELLNHHVHDYSMRLADAGFRTAVCKNAVFWHSTKSPTILGHSGAEIWRQMSDLSIQKMNERWGDRWRSLSG